MLRNILILSTALAVWTGLTPRASGQDNIDSALVRAETLYFEAKFNESIQMLSPINETLRTQQGRTKEKISAKFQLALANVGLNNAAAAKSLLMEIYALDPEFAVDAQQFSPKVLTLANEAKADQNIERCKSAAENGRKSLAGEEIDAVLNILRSLKGKCPELAALEPPAADLLFRKGLVEYRQGNLPRAQDSFQAALKLSPGHEMAAEYLDLAENKLQVAKDRAILDWQKSFQMGQFKEAAAAYRQVGSFTSVDDEGDARTLNMMRAEYRKALDPLVESWNDACANGDFTRTDEIRDQISELLPDPSFVADLRSKMAPCTPPAPTEAAPVARLNPRDTSAAAPKAQTTDSSAPAGRACFQMDSQLAMLRLKQRVEPVFSTQAIAFLQNSTTVLVKVRIDDAGNVTVIDAAGPNILLTNPVRAAVAAWKFTPAMDEKGPRCVEAELPIVISRR